MELSEKTREDIYEMMREKTRVKSLFTWVPFTSVAASSEMQGSSLEDLSLITFEPQTRSWECARYCKFPQEIVIRLNYRCEVAHVILMAKEDRFIPEVEVHIGDGISGSFMDVDYRLAGRGQNISTAPKQLNTLGIGTYIKIVFVRGPPQTNKNPCGQVGLALLKVWGQPLGYYKGVVNEATPLKGGKEEVDKVLIEMGLPIEHVNWSYVDEQSYTYAPVDDDTRQTLIDMEKVRDQAFKSQDYELLKSLVTDLKIVFEIGNDILKLKRELELAVGREDFDQAIEIRNKLRRLELQRDQYDALYETSRYEDMIIMARPSTAQLRAVQLAEEEDRRRREFMRIKSYLIVIERQKELEEEEARRRRMMELDEAERLRRLQEEEEERRRKQLEDAARRKAQAEERKSKVKSKTDFTDQKSKESDINIKGDPLEFNDGDVDLEPYLKPLLSAAGGNIEKLGLEALRRALSDGTLLVCGVKLWTALHSETWRHRESAAQAFYDYLRQPLKKKYIGKTKRLFLAACDVAQIACRDKLLQIYFIGLKILETAMAPPICGDDIPHKVINNAVKPFVQMLIDKISELNYRARDISLNTLIGLFRHPAVDIRQLIEGIMDVTEKGPTPDKLQWRIILARLEILLHVVQEFGINHKAWDWRVVFQKLVCSSFFNQNPDVRLIAIEVALEMYKTCGAELKRMVQEVEGIKPNLLQTIIKRMKEIDEGRGTKYVVGHSDDGSQAHYQNTSVEKPKIDMGAVGLEQVPETHEWSEHTPKNQQAPQ